MYSSSSLLWCQVRWEDRAEPKGTQALWWCKGEWAARWGQPDKNSHESDGKGQGSIMMLQTRRFYRQSNLLPILSWPSFAWTQTVQRKQVTWGQHAEGPMSGHLPKSAVRITDTRTNCPERLWNLHPQRYTLPIIYIP